MSPRPGPGQAVSPLDTPGADQRAHRPWGVQKRPSPSHRHSKLSARKGPVPPKSLTTGLTSVLLLDSTVLALKTAYDASNDRRKDIQKQGILKCSFPETLSKELLKYGYDNFRGFFVESKAITPLTESI